MARTKRPGHSLVEVCVVAVVLTLSAACVIPALAQVKDKEARAKSTINLKQLGLAVHTFHDAMGVFPPGNDAKNFSVHAKLLPYLEQDNLYKKVDLEKASDDKANAEVGTTFVAIYVSPRDSAEVKKGTGPTNYFFNAGSKHALADNDGMFPAGKGVKLADVRDGLSNTIMTGETLRGDSFAKGNDVKRRHVQLNDKDALANLKEESGVAEFKDGKNVAADRGARWIDGRFLQTTFTGTRALDDEKPDVDCNGLGGLSSLRSLDDVVLVGIGDGSVRAVKATLKFDVWKIMITRDGGETIKGD